MAKSNKGDEGGPSDHVSEALSPEESIDLRERAVSLRDRAADLRDEAADLRDRAADLRDEAADRRDEAADRRDEVADRRDEAARLWDLSSDLRDEEMELTERATGIVSPGVAQSREHGAKRRAGSRRDRQNSHLDRGAGAIDREGAKSDRIFAAETREHLARDALTGAYARGPGLVELQREIDRASRSGDPLVVAFIDLDGLKTINDTRGHAAGDVALKAVVDAVQGTLRPYDILIRLGGDEFLAVISKTTVADSHDLPLRLNESLVKEAGAPTVSVGLAELEEGDTPQDVISRADADLYAGRAAVRGT